MRTVKLEIGELDYWKLETHASEGIPGNTFSLKSVSRRVQHRQRANDILI
jgi:hypothetical protein